VPFFAAARQSAKEVEMLKRNGIVGATILGASVLIVVPPRADEPVPTAAPATQLPTAQVPAPVKTGKERLSSKASDEQRVDNCKVPQELRGTTVRSDTCDDQPPATPTN
jgi:hypothetical protein